MKRASETGFKCETSIEVGLKKTIEWFGKNNNLEKSKYNSFK